VADPRAITQPTSENHSNTTQITTKDREGSLEGTVIEMNIVHDFCLPSLVSESFNTKVHEVVIVPVCLASLSKSSHYCRHAISSVIPTKTHRRIEPIVIPSSILSHRVY
jgi:hypothetical protein